jgi:hypothetical protein
MVNILLKSNILKNRLQLIIYNLLLLNRLLLLLRLREKGLILFMVFRSSFLGAESIVPLEKLLLAYTNAAGMAKSTRLLPPCRCLDLEFDLLWRFDVIHSIKYNNILF